MKEYVYTGAQIENALTQLYRIEEYNSCRAWYKDKELNLNDLRVVIYNEEKDYISIEWSIDDIAAQAKRYDCKFSKDDLREILNDIYMNHDATIGINWDVIDYFIEDFIADKTKRKNINIT